MSTDSTSNLPDEVPVADAGVGGVAEAGVGRGADAGVGGVGGVGHGGAGAAPGAEELLGELTAEPETPQLVTPEGGKDGVNRCPKCGASDVAFVAATASLMCRFCRHEWTTQTLDEVMGLSVGIGDLKGTLMSTAAVDIEDEAAMVTLKCAGCGAEVVIDTDHNLKARCHWCKSVLSLNNRIPNGAVPDGILPFTISKAQAMTSIKAFADQRKSFASPAFAESFIPENVMGVYLPYMTVDGNIDTRLEGFGEILLSSRRIDDNKTEYTADLYQLGLDMELEVDDLMVETSSSKANINSEISTNNIINALLPYDVKNMVRFNANYLGQEFTSERRDMDVTDAELYAARHFLTIARNASAASVRKFTRGVRWDAEKLHIEGSRWTAVLVPVWLYGFIETRRGKQITHYIAVNGRTGATLGSVPINWAKARLVAWGTAAAVSAVCWPLAIMLAIADLGS